MLWYNYLKSQAEQFFQKEIDSLLGKFLDHLSTEILPRQIQVSIDSLAQKWEQEIQQKLSAFHEVINQEILKALGNWNPQGWDQLQEKHLQLKNTIQKEFEKLSRYLQQNKTQSMNDRKRLEKWEQSFLKQLEEKFQEKSGYVSKKCFWIVTLFLAAFQFFLLIFLLFWK